MMRRRAAADSSIAREALAGLAGGLAGSFAMNVFARATRTANNGREAAGAAPGVDRDGRGVQPPQAESHAEDDAPTRVGRVAYELATGERPDPRAEHRLGTAAHYAFGAAAGVVYALLSRAAPSLRAGFGTAYGTLVWIVADEGVMPALGLSRGAGELPINVLGFALTGHYVYGATLEGVRGVISGSR